MPEEPLKVNPAVLAKYGSTVKAGEFIKNLLHGPSEDVEAEKKQARFEQRWLELFPGSAADVASYKANPDCTCRHKLTALLVESIDKTSQLIREFHPRPELVTGLERDEQDRTMKRVSAQTNLSGQVWELEATAEEWGKSVKHLRDINAVFNQVIPVVENGKLRLFFL